jgi:hypothetical protein
METTYKDNGLFNVGFWFARMTVRIWTPPVLQAKSPLVFGYDCTRISDLLMSCKALAKMDYSRVCSSSLSRALGHSGQFRFCKRRFDLFTISGCCFTIVVERFSQPAGNLFRCSIMPTLSWRFCSPRQRLLCFYASLRIGFVTISCVGQFFCRPL